MSAKPSMSASTDAAARADAIRCAPISFGTPAVHVERRGDGTIYLRPKAPLGDYPVRITDRLHHWAEAEPDRVFMAERERRAAAGGRSPMRELLAASRGTSPLRCWRAGFRPRSRSSFSPAIRSIMR